ncbi:MAG: peptidyl-prolyl cis-trans isomerase [Labilithrix sp.]|nr:peptidyl-prolyl cis-trans isomerase [Labilithrix sp.]
MILRVRAIAAVAMLVPAIACGGAASRTSITAGAAGDPNVPNGAAGAARVAAEPRTVDPTAARATQTETPGLTLGGSAGNPSTSAPSTIGTAAATTEKAPAEEAPAAVDEPAELPKKIAARHVLVQWMGAERAGKSVLRSREQALVLAQEVHRRAKAGDDLGRLAVEYSDEPGAGNRGGSLGRFSKGQMVGAFEQVAFRLKVGEISEIVETPFGFHVIQRTE